MPTGQRVRSNNVYGTVSDNPMLIGAVSFTSLGLSLLPIISDQHAVIVLDPKRVFGEPEIVVVTFHSSLATTATVVRAQYGTVVRQHPQGTAWTHAPIDEDYLKIATSVTRPLNPYEGQIIYETDTGIHQYYDGVVWAQFGTSVVAGELLERLPDIIGYWDASQLIGSVASSVSLLPDLSGYGNHLYQFTTASQPTIASGPNSRKVLAMGTTKWMQRTSFGDGDWLEPLDYTQPTSFIAVVKAAATAPAARTILSASGSTHLLNLNSTTASPEISAGGTPVNGGPPSNDGLWHIIAAVFAGTGCAIFLDGYLVASSTSNGYGTSDLIGFYLGTSNGSTQMFDGEIAEVIACNTSLSHQSIYDATSLLASKWNIDIGPIQLPAQPETTTSPNTTAVRIWEPPNLAAGVPLVMFNHQYGGNELINAGFTAYSLVQACIAQGWRVAASNLHGNSWGNNASMDDNYDLFSMLHARQAITKVVMVGLSMGGIHTVLSIPDARIPIVGCALIDAALDINNVYTAFKTSIDTAYGISSYASLPAGKDPMTRPAADFGTVRMRFYASAADTTFSKTANTDAFRTKISGTALESGLSVHLGVHLASDAFWPSDVVSFIGRCIA